MLFKLKLTGEISDRLNSFNKEKLLYVAAFAAIYIIWGSTYYGIKVAIQTIPPFLMASSRFFIAGSIMLVAAWLTKAQLPKLKNIQENAILGFLLLLMGNGGVVLASEYLPSGIIALLVTVEPIWIVLLVFLKKQGKQPGVLTIAGIVLGFAGTFLLLSPETLDKSTVGIEGYFALLVSTLSWAIGSMYAVKANEGVSALFSSGLQMISGSIYMAIVGSLKGEWSNIHPETFSGSSIMAFAYLIVFGSLIGYSAYAYLLKVASPNKVATHAYVNPLVAVMLGTFIGNEQFTLKIGLASLLLISGVVLVMTKK